MKYYIHAYSVCIGTLISPLFSTLKQHVDQLCPPSTGDIRREAEQRGVKTTW